MKTKKLSVLLLLVFTTVASVMSASVIQKRIPSRGTVYTPTLGLDAFWDMACTQPVTSVDWGQMRPSESVTQLIYLKNTGDVPLNLNMTLTDWTPAEAAVYISVTWNAEGSVLGVNDPMSVNLVLTVSSNIVGVTDFNMNIVITGAET